MDPVLNFIVMLLSSPALQHVPIILKILGALVVGCGVLASLVSPFVALWHAFVLFFSALAAIPGLGFLAKVAEFLKVNESKVTDFSQGKLFPILNRFSTIPLPKKADDAIIQPDAK